MSAMTSTTSMTPIDYAALAERLEAHAECHANVEPYDDEQRQWAADLRTVVSLLEGMADAKPVAWLHRLHFPDGTSDAVLSFSEDVPDDFGERELVEVSYPLYKHPAPQPQPERQPVSEPTDWQQIDRLLKTLRYLIGIAERGEGRKIRDDETIEQFVLGYVKRLEAGEAALRAEVEALRRTATDRAGIIDSVREWTRGVVNDNWALRAEVEALRADAERLNFVEQTFIEEGSGLELYPFGVDEQYAEDGNTVIDRKFVFGGKERVGPTLRAAIDAALAQAKDAEAR